MEPEFFTRAELYARGFTRWTLRRAVASGEILHVRRDRYLAIGENHDIEKAIRVGGRLTCLSLLQVLGVFVLSNEALHVQVEPNAGRLRSPSDTKTPLNRFDHRGTRLHWVTDPDATRGAAVVPFVGALAQAVRCQPPVASIATIDSALNLGVLATADLPTLFDLLPRRYRILEELLDARAESGPETLVRLMARRLGCVIDLQREFDGVGRVDLVLDGWLVVECDSKQFHSTWKAQANDRDRDLALAARGYVTLRLTAAAIMYRPGEVFAALRALVASRRG